MDRFNCAKCPSGEKACRSPEGSGPAWCPTKTEEEAVAAGMEAYRAPEVTAFARAASLQEAECYAGRDERPYVLDPVKPRLQELIEFSRRMGYKRLGLAFCAGLSGEAATLSGILEAHGFEVVGVVCKVGGVPKEEIGIRDAEKIRIGEFESMCNPIAQAGFLNRAKTDFNIMLGLCIGHDSLFLRHVEGLTTVFAVKDRVTGHNPLAALYTSRSYYRKLARPRQGDSGPGDEGK
jgi:uncharacterized metal-binding protein